jgi:hypothetical protein
MINNINRFNTRTQMMFAKPISLAGSTGFSATSRQGNEAADPVQELVKEDLEVSSEPPPKPKAGKKQTADV